MRSTRNSILTIGALASGGLWMLGVTPAMAQGMGSRSATATPYANGATTPYASGAATPYASGAASPYAAPGASPYAPPGGTVYASPGAPPPAAPGASPSGYPGAGPGAAAGAGGASYGMPGTALNARGTVAPASPYATQPGGAMAGQPLTSMTMPGPGRGIPVDPSMTPASATGLAMPGVPSPATPPPHTGSMPGTGAPQPASWAADAAAAPEKKPSAMRRFFSFLWHGGSDASTEGRPYYRDPATGRTDLPGARPWSKPAPN